MSRYKFCFWLDGSKDDELLIAETVDELKRRRSFSSVIREGILIINELRQGRVDALLERYPWIVDTIAEMIPPPPPPTPPPMDMTPLFEQFRRYMAEQGGGAEIPDSRDSGFPAMMPAMKQPGQGVGTLGAGRKLTLSLMDDDDDQDTIVLNKTSGANGANIMKSMLGLLD